MARTEKQALHDKAIRVARGYLHQHGHSVRTMPENSSKFDLLVDDKTRLEVKAAKCLQLNGPTPSWQFNLHRHGIRTKNDADFYWLYLAAVPGFKFGVSLIVPESEIPTATNLWISPRSLLTRWSKWYMRLDLFQPFKRQGAA